MIFSGPERLRQSVALELMPKCKCGCVGRNDSTCRGVRGRETVTLDIEDYRGQLDGAQVNKPRELTTGEEVKGNPSAHGLSAVLALDVRADLVFDWSHLALGVEKEAKVRSAKELNKSDAASAKWRLQEKRKIGNQARLAQSVSRMRHSRQGSGRVRKKVFT